MAAPNVDGSNFNRTNSGTTLGVDLTTANAGDIIVVVAWKFNVGTMDVVTSMASTGLTFQKAWEHKVTGANSVTQSMEVWWAYAENALTNQTITAIWSGATNPAGLVAFGVHGANVDEPWDLHGDLPATAENLTNTNNAVTVPDISTNAPETLIIGVFNSWSQSQCDPTDTWEDLFSDDINTTGTNRGRGVVQAKQFFSPQSGLSVTFGVINNNWGASFHAIKSAAETLPSRMSAPYVGA